MVKQSRTVRLPWRSPSHTLPPLGRLSVPDPSPPAPPPSYNTHAEMKSKTDTISECTHEHTVWDFEVGLRIHMFNLHRYEITFFIHHHTHMLAHSHSHRLRPNMVEAGYFTSQQVWTWPSHIACQGKAISYILSAVSLHSVWEDPQDAVTLPHGDREEDPSAHHIRPNDNCGLRDPAALKQARAMLSWWREKKKKKKKKTRLLC